MLNFFDWFVNFFETIGTIITTLIESLITAFAVIQAAVAIPSYFSLIVPGILSTCMIALIALAVIKFLLGR